jgi:NADPH:quinone reductase-like Zn-dependent oxidoreductase
MSLQRVTRSTVIDAPIERVWEVLRDFNSHVYWHPIIATSEIEDGLAPDQVGCIRNFTLKDGNALREQLLTLDDYNCVSTYCIVDSTIPLQRYVATVRLKPVTDGRRTFWHWQSTFATPPGRERELADSVGNGVYEAGFAALRDYLRGRPQNQAGAHQRTAAPMRNDPLEATAIVLNARGGADQLKLASIRVPAPAAGEVRIRQTAIGVNYIDVYVRTGLYTGLVEPGGIPGFEAAGTVIDVGADVTHLLPGDRVAYACPPAGAYTSMRTMNAERVLRLPDHVTEEQAAATMLKGLTAEYILFRLHRLAAGEVVLVHAAAGGLGMLTAQWARALGARVIGSVGSEEKARIARAYCDHVVVNAGGRFADAVSSVTAGKGADLIVDGLGGAAREENLKAIATTGHWVSVGQAGGAWQPIDPDTLTHKSVTFSRPVIFHYTAQPRQLREMATRVFEALRSGVLRPQPARYALSAAATAHSDLESRRTTGQVVLLG